MPIDDEFVIILAKKFGYLEKRVTYLEGKCRGQHGTIQKLQKKLRKVRKSTKTKIQDKDKLIERKVLEDPVDLKPDVDTIKISKPNENLKGNSEECDKNDKKLSQKLIVQLGVRCENNPKYLNLNQAIIAVIERKPKKSQDQRKTENTQQAKTVQISSKRKKSVKKSHICSYCSKSFPKFSELSKHMRVHTGERPYKCKICSKSFTQMGNLKKHSRVHTGEKPFSCTFCSKSFSQVQNRNDHINTHTGERPYSCPVCLKTFIRSTALCKHKKNIHRQRINDIKIHERTRGQEMSLIKVSD